MTTPRSARRAAILLIALLPAFATGQQTLTIPADVDSVATGGRWSADGMNGTYRVIVRTGGFEHMLSIVQVDWIVEEGSDEPGRVVASKIAETGSWLMQRPRIVRRTGSWRVLLDGVETHFSPMLRGTWEIELGRPSAITTKLVQR